MIRRVSIFVFLASFSDVFGQSSIQALEAGQDPNVLYRNEATYKIFAHSRGVGFGYRRAKHVTGKSKSLLEFEGLTLKHPKEIKVTGTTEQGKRFIYGKVNSVGLIRCAAGMQHTIYSRADKKSIEIRCSYLAGLTFAFAKPYYVAVYRGKGFINSKPTYIKYDSEILTQDSVVGRGPFINGIDEIKIYPGLTGKFNISFEYSAYSNWVRAIETGVACDYFPKALPIMAKNPAENFVVTLYVGFVFGKKWF